MAVAAPERLYYTDSDEANELLATDPGSRSDVPSWARLSGNELVEATEEDGVFRYVIRKT